MTKKHVKNGDRKYRICLRFELRKWWKMRSKSRKNRWNVWKADFHRTTILDGLFAKYHMLAPRKPIRNGGKIHEKSMEKRWSEKVCNMMAKWEKMEPKWEPKSGKKPENYEKNEVQKSMRKKEGLWPGAVPCRRARGTTKSTRLPVGNLPTDNLPTDNLPKQIPKWRNLREKIYCVDFFQGRIQEKENSWRKSPEGKSERKNPEGKSNM